MRNRFLMSTVALIAGLSLVAAACSDDDDTTTDDPTTTTMAESTDDTMDEGAENGETIVDIAAGNPNFSTLVEAVTLAGLAEALSGEGPLTVFAPTNEAFDALPEGTLDDLLADPTGDLAAILQLHVVEGLITAEDAIAAAGECITTISGEQLRVELDGDNVTVGGATVTDPDLTASNGVIHVIDSVIVAASDDC